MTAAPQTTPAMMKLMMTGRTGMERRGLRADGEDARTDRHGTPMMARSHHFRLRLSS